MQHLSSIIVANEIRGVSSESASSANEFFSENCNSSTINNNFNCNNLLFSKNAHPQFANNMAAESPVKSASNFMATKNLKRWNSVPMGINFAYPSSPSSISSSCSNASTSSGDASTPKRNLERSLKEEQMVQKTLATPRYLFERRPSSASAGSILSRHRYSTDAIFMLTSPIPIRLRDRGIEKLKREANIRRCIETDYAGEKLSITGAAIMGSLDEFSIEEASTTPIVEQRKRTQSLTEPVHVLTNFLPSPCTPSPTRVEKQCYSPSMQQVVRGIALSPATSPSPSRHHCVRSLSPIAVRGSLKRKCDSDAESYFGPIPAKRVYSSMPSTPPPPPFTVQDRFSKVIQTSQSIEQSLSANSMDSESSNSTVGSDYANTSGQYKFPFYHHLHQSNSPFANVVRSPVSSTDDPGVIDQTMDDT